jgi:hypothetical protein
MNEAEILLGFAASPVWQVLNVVLAVICLPVAVWQSYRFAMVFCDHGWLFARRHFVSAVLLAWAFWLALFGALAG